MQPYVCFKQVFRCRYNVPKNVSELSALQMSGEEAVVQCPLEDEALLEY